MSKCNHDWETCPVHGVGENIPSFRTVLNCVYGGVELNDGGTWDESTSEKVVDSILGGLE